MFFLLKCKIINYFFLVTVRDWNGMSMWGKERIEMFSHEQWYECEYEKNKKKNRNVTEGDGKGGRGEEGDGLKLSSKN